jgi:hypothetical protein
MDKNDLQKKIKEDEDYIRAPKFGNSLNKFVSKNSKELKDSDIARLLMTTEQEIERIYLEAVEFLKAKFSKKKDKEK